MYHWNQLPHLTGVRVTGPDAKAFAHAQFTTPFDSEAAFGWHATAWCNPKGKVFATMLARSNEAAVELIAPALQAKALASRLPMYAIGRKVDIETDLNVAGCLADCGEVETRLGLDNSRGLDLERADAVTDDQQTRIWMVRDICAGIVWLEPSSSEQFLPQALGLEARGGLSYKKGCYPGQEVVARVHYLGRAKEILSGFRREGTGAADDRNLLSAHGTRVGRVLQSVRAGPETIGLAVVSREATSDSELFWGDREVRLCDPAQLC